MHSEVDRINSHWKIVGIATAAEHSELNAAAGQDATFTSRVISIASVKISRAACPDPATLTQQIVQRGIEERLSVTTFCHDISKHCDSEAIKHTNSHPYPNMRISWSQTIDSIATSVAACQRTSYATEQNACVYVNEILKIHVQKLLDKCIPGAYALDCAMQIITKFIWNRSCAEAFSMLLDDILAEQWPHEMLSLSERRDVLDLIETCLQYLTTDCDKTLANLEHYRRSVPDLPEISLTAAWRALLAQRQR